MLADSRYDELERRVRTVEEGMNGEKHLTRYAVDQTVRNGEVLHALRTDVSAVIMRVDHLGADMATVKAALVMHGRALDVLQQDVRQMRGEMAAVRSEVAVARSEMATMQRVLATMHGETATMQDEIATMHGEVGTMRSEMATMHGEVGTMRTEMATMREEAAARHNDVLAAIHALGAGGGAPSV